MYKPDNYDMPNWEPLEKFFKTDPDACASWMWMYEHENVNVYKNRESRRYLYLKPDGTGTVHA